MSIPIAKKIMTRHFVSWAYMIPISFSFEWESEYGQYIEVEVLINKLEYDPPNSRDTDIVTRIKNNCPYILRYTYIWSDSYGDEMTDQEMCRTSQKNVQTRELAKQFVEQGVSDLLWERYNSDENYNEDETW